VTITLHVNPTDTPEKFASDLDRAIEGLKRMQTQMTTCPYCHRPEAFVGPPLDNGRGPVCYRTHAPHAADVIADCEKRRQR
jgi:hypothetical protein